MKMFFNVRCTGLVDPGLCVCLWRVDCRQLDTVWRICCTRFALTATDEIIKLNFRLIRTEKLVNNIDPHISCRAGIVGAVGKISAFQPQGPQFDLGSAEIQIFL